MTTYEKRPSNHDWCPPPTGNPADQPPAPGSCADCEPDKPTTPPALPKPDDCPDAECGCKCPPSKKPPSPTCLESASARQGARIAAGDKAKAFKADLDAFQAKAKAATQDYTRDAYDKLVKQWNQEDRDIAELIRKLVCAVPCWKCIIDCYVCPILDDLHNTEKWLNGTDALYTTLDNLYDLQYWRTRDRIIKENRFNRIKAVLTAWEKPAQTIQKALNDDQALLDASNKALGTGPGPVVYDVFLRLVPMHLAIAPVAINPERTTRIDKMYTDLCGCDKGAPDKCCGPDTGVLSLRQRLIGPQPYLIDPDEYYNLICCLVDKRYEPAKEALTQAEIDAADIDNKIATYKAQIDSSLKSLERDAKASIPSVVDCCDYEEHPDEPPSSRAR